MIKKILELNEKFNNILSKIKIKDRYIYLILFILSLSFCISFSANGLFHYDTVQLAVYTEKAGVDHSFEEFFKKENFWRPGTYMINIFAFFIINLITGLKSAEYVTLFVQIIFGSLAVVMFYILINEIFKDRSLALISSLIYAFNPVFLSAITQGKEHGTSEFFVFLFLFVLIKAINSRSKILFIVSAILLNFVISLREFNLVFIPLFLLYFINLSFSVENKKFKIILPNLKSKLADFLFFIVPFIILFIIQLKTYLYGIIELSLGYKLPYGTMSLRIMSDLFNIFTPVLTLLFVASLISVFFIKVMLKQKVYLLIWLVGFFIYLSSNGAYSERHLLILFLPFIVFSCIFLNWLFRKSNLLGVIIILYLLISMFLIAYPFISFRHNYVGTKEFSLFVKENTEDDANIIIYGDYCPFIKYYGNRTCFGVDDEIKYKIANLTETKKPLYITLQSGVAQGGGKDLFDYLLITYNITEVGSKEFEDYHHSDLVFVRYNETLVRIAKK